MACNSPEVINEPCRGPECYTDGSVDGSRRDAPSPPDGVVADSGPSRSPLCGTTGCFPGNWNACGPAAFPDAAFLAWSAPDDAADSTDVLVADAALDAATDSGDAPSTPDAGTDVCRDGTHDASSPPDVLVDTTVPIDATADAVSEPSPDATEDTADAPPPTVDASTPPDAGGQGDATVDMGTSDEPRILQGCYIKPAAAGVVTECAPVGPGVDGSACNDSRECGALLACVEVDQRAACRPVSCGLPPLCLKGTYYEEAPLRAMGATRRDLNVPVCLPADNCTLLVQPSPCPAGKVCAVVGNEGETTCTEPGSASLGEACDETGRCAEGLLCSRFSNQCVKICHVDRLGECTNGTCQGGNRSLPDGFGICVGQTPAGGR
jgi:hypothetical protein